jgi:hypothetical protein
MGKRAVTSTTEAEIRALSLPQLNQQIAWMEYRANTLGSFITAQICPQEVDVA